MSLSQILNKRTLPAALLLVALGGFTVFVLRAYAAVEEKITTEAAAVVRPLADANTAEHAQFRERLDKLEKAAEAATETNKIVKCIRATQLRRPCE